VSGGLLVVTAHPDDEVLIAGGALAACAAAGLPTAVVCLTRGEEGPISDVSLATRETLGAVRENELRAACAELGVAHVRCYRRADSHLAWSDGSAIARQLARAIERLRPAAVVTFWEDGLYWHPDHIAALHYTRRALAQLADPPPLYGSTWPQGHVSELVGALEAAGLPAGMWSLDPAAFGGDAEDLRHARALDVRPFVGVKLRALRCHRTQLDDAHALSAIPEEIAERFLGTEWFIEASDAADHDWLEAAVARGREAVSARA
jgi:N-acetyl-1-D-myo-inositol-2-amino-2-deoxy-alpha-D-glucopyranoside deacetylase